MVAVMSCAMLFIAMAPDVCADTQHSTPQDFDIPRQPLQAALEQYGVHTGRALLYETRILAGRFSSPVVGRYTPDAALHRLIDGTGVRADYVNANAFVLSLAATPPPRAVERIPPGKARYYGLLQAGIEQALCGDPVTAPGGYRVGLRFWLDGAGVMQQFELARSTGNVGLDEKIMVRLRGFSVGERPPPGMRQPLTVLIEPGDRATTGDCAAGPN
ncbi:outer membrane TonB-dependent heme receptor [Bordetella ansorpii]|uniref:Outer membrane TonB-dependent heme receptor n=1 Tax=Bordetella ansorpii TaxID=288768 RepID=A0A157PV76_9BORD|nr:STN domain-containing protein [Bordetella ansorpii]SAI37266.1 outer membrane TonB-dependent heme receptor [Bordetella ansorpii]